ncbi:MAG: hypothetical protein ACTSU2_03780 [Promethearchaeota archaeon]
MPLLQKLNYDLKDLLASQDQLNNLVFLAGASISMDPPSNFASARQIMDAILKFISPDEDTYNKLKNIKDLRFEYIFIKKQLEDLNRYFERKLLGFRIYPTIIRSIDQWIDPSKFPKSLKIRK